MTAGVGAARAGLPSSGPAAAALALAVAVGAALRLFNIDLLSYWFDEAYTVEIVSYGLGHVLDTVPETEFTPPLYYLLAWAWGSFAGTEEAALRSLSAVFGISTVLAVYFAGRALVDVRTGVGAAALCAVNPLLVWYSQEARAYSLLALLSALSLLFLAMALRDAGDRRALVAWAAAAALALCTHYFAVFVIVPQAAWLLWSRRDRASLAAVGVVAAAGLALLVLALEQKETALLGFLDETPLSDRAWGVLTGLPGGRFADTPPDRFPVEAALFAGALLLSPLSLRRLDPQKRRGAVLALGLSAVAIGVPLALSPLGFDYVVSRNFIAAVPPLCIGLAAVLVAAGASRGGLLLLAAILVVSLVAVGRFSDESLRRADWREIDAWLGRQDPERVIVTHWPGQPTLETHRDTVMLGPEDTEVPVRELVVFLQLGGEPRPPGPGWVEEPRRTVSGIEVATFRATRAEPLSFAEIAEAASFAGFAVLDRPDGEGRL